MKLRLATLQEIWEQENPCRARRAGRRGKIFCSRKLGHDKQYVDHVGQSRTGTYYFWTDGD